MNFTVEYIAWILFTGGITQWIPDFTRINLIREFKAKNGENEQQSQYGQTSRKVLSKLYLVSEIDNLN